MFVTSFNKVMSYDRFDLIWRYLHLQDNEAVPVDEERLDKLRKIRWYLDYLDQKFSCNFIPKSWKTNATIDEIMIKFKGTVIPTILASKPNKVGWKIVEHGRQWHWIYAPFPNIYWKRGFSRKRIIVQSSDVFMFQYAWQKPSSLFWQLLYKRGIVEGLAHTRCSSLWYRTNHKGSPKQLLPKQLKLNKHEFKVAQKDELTFCVWQDTNTVCVLSNFHDPEIARTVNRRSGMKIQRLVVVPKMLSDYQKNMKGVDLCDQTVEYYLLNHRSKKWWRRICFYLGTDHLTWRGGLWFFVSFRIFFSDNTRVRIFIFFVAQDFHITLYDKTSESDFFFFSSTKIRIFFSAT